MRITIEGSSEELARIAKVLNGAATAEKKAGIPPLLTELTGEKFSGDDDKINELAEAIRNAGKENAPQTEAAEQGRTFASFKSAFEKFLKRVRRTLMDFEELELGADELTPSKPYTAERAEEIAEINGEIASLFAEING